MTVKRATLEIESTDRLAYFEAAGADLSLPEGSFPVLIVEIQDFEEALDLVETINRSRAQRKRKPTEPVPSPAPVTEKSANPPRGTGDGSGQEVTPAKEAAAKARALGNKLSEVTG